VTVIGLGSVRSCGVTTLAVALAATWPAGRRVLLVEADPAGGSLAGASGWPPEPSLTSLAAAARRGLDPGAIWEHCHQLPGGAAVLAAPASDDRTATALGVLDGLAGVVGHLDADVLVDCGRLTPGPPGWLWGGAERVVLVVRPRVADLHSLATWLDAHRPGVPLGLVTVGDGPYPDDEISEALGVEVLARVPWDPHAADALVTVAASDRDLRMAPLVRAARTLADQLAPTPVPAPTPDGHDSTPSGAGRTAVLSAGRAFRTWRPKLTAGSANGSHPDGVAE
jgi:hypothetical protein